MSSYAFWVTNQINYRRCSQRLPAFNAFFGFCSTVNMLKDQWEAAVIQSRAQTFCLSPTETAELYGGLDEELRVCVENKCIMLGKRAGSWVFRWLQSQQKRWWWAKRIPLEEAGGTCRKEQASTLRWSTALAEVPGKWLCYMKGEHTLLQTGERSFVEAWTEGSVIKSCFVWAEQGRWVVSSYFVARTAASILWVW